MMSEEVSKKKKVSIREGLFTVSVDGTEFISLQGSRCVHCGEVGLGSLKLCANCGHKDLDVIPLSKEGQLWTYTVIRHEPPGDYKGPKPFKPFGVGLVELPEGLRVLSVIACGLDDLRVGMNMILDVFLLYRDDENNDVMTFRFKSTEETGQ